MTSPDPSRRRFFGAALAASAAAALGLPRRAPAFVPRRIEPAIACSVNGLPHVEMALAMLAEGADTLDVAVAAVQKVEDDPNDQSVGYGGLPNEEGVVELDASCMHGPSNAAGAVASLRNVRHAAAVARDVLWRTDHVMLVGEGALRFARSMGYVEEDLLTPASREAWLAWRARRGRDDDWIEPHEKRVDAPAPPPGPKDQTRTTGTINFDVCNAKGEVSGVTTTSGLAFKIPGRVGDSPILGAGLFVDGRVGAAGATGRGEAVIQCGASHVVVEAMRQGRHPKDACHAGVLRIIEANRTPYLRDERGRPTFQVQLYAVDAKGRSGAASIWPSPYAYGDARGAHRGDCAAVLER